MKSDTVPNKDMTRGPEWSRRSGSLQSDVKVRAK